ncbi:SsrA-binding protein SmpB [Soehngenia saccharolytica]|nr:SsrA-binding protein SmpB [Soehngenia saccharolytica]
MNDKQVKIVASNKKARHDYFIEDTIEAGIVLTGTEVKSIRQGKVNIKDSYANIENGEVFLYNMHISPYEQGNIYNVDPLRVRKLLLNKREIRKLIGLTTIKGYTLVPLSLYFKNGKVKVELAIAKGKKLYDKRETIAKRDAERKIQQIEKEKYR